MSGASVYPSGTFASTRVESGFDIAVCNTDAGDFYRNFPCNSFVSIEFGIKYLFGNFRFYVASMSRSPPATVNNCCFAWATKSVVNAFTSAS